MVVITLKGGLGNQLFQYAFGRRIAIERNEQLYFNIKPLISNRDKATPRDFKLERLPNTLIADEDDARRFNDIYFGERRAKIISDDTPKADISSIINDPKVKAILIDGYFQDEFYFEPSKEFIRQELKLFLDTYDMNATVVNKLLPRDQDTVSIHLRRTDYLEPEKLLVHGICDVDYYEKAIKILNSKLSNPQYYIFSDDPQEANQLFDGLLDKKTNVSGLLAQAPSKDNDLIELALMSRCKNFILANSSFSWWGSYLSDADPKLVIAPTSWLLSEELKSRGEDIALPSWIRV